MEHRLWITEIVNRLLAGPAVWLLSSLGIRVEEPSYPIPNHIATEIFIFFLCIVFFTWLRFRLSVAKPGAVQQTMELLIDGVYSLIDDIIGHHGRRYLPMVGTIGLFILLMNLISVIPGFESPTANYTVTCACALVAFLHYNYVGVRHHGLLGYVKHFMGPIPALAILMLPIELISHAARILSLTVRLWVNMFVSELLYGVFLWLTGLLYLFLREQNRVLGLLATFVPAVAPLIFIGLHIFVAFLQAFVFTLLPIVYLSGAVAEEH